MEPIPVREPLRQLAVSAPVRFIISDEGIVERVMATPDFEQSLQQDDALRATFARSWELCWIALTFIRLRDAGVGPIDLASEPSGDAINVHVTLGPSVPEPRSNLFCVATQADYPRLLWAQLSIQQNLRAGRAAEPTIWHWPQPCLIPRPAARGDVRRVAFFGEIGANLTWDEARWHAMLAPLGMEFVAPGAPAWHDYSRVDIAVGIRDFAGKTWDHKPPSKLVNAWLAGVPFIGGGDSAFAQVGRAGVDHLVARDPAGLIEAITRLRDDPAFYHGLVAAGQAAATRFTNDRLVRDWVDLLEGPVEQRYRQWRSRPRFEQARLAVLAPAHRTCRATKAMGRRIIPRALIP